MRLFDCNYLEDIEFVEFIMNSELGLGLDKSIFNSKNSVLDFFNKFCGVLNEFGIVVDGDVIIFSDWTFYHYSFFLVNAEFEIVGGLFFWVEQFTNFFCTTWTLAQSVKLCVNYSKNYLIIIYRFKSKPLYTINP